MYILRTVFLGFLLALLVLLSRCHEADPGPTIISISPNDAPVGKMVTIIGTNFSSASSLDNVVEFNGISAIVSSSTSTTITAKVPKGATSGKVTVAVKGKGKAQSPIDFSVNDCSTCGFIEKFSLSNDYNYSIEPINASRVSYENRANRRGINFSVNKKIRIKAIGGLFRKAGSYPMELLDRATNTVIYTTTISVIDTENFTFENVNTDIQLIPTSASYTLRYCGENHDSVYDLFPPRPNGGSNYLQPFNFGDVILTSISYIYINDCSQPNSGQIAWQDTGMFMRGIVDFKYEIIE